MVPAVLVEVDAMDDVAAGVDTLVMRVVATPAKVRGTPPVGRKPEELKLKPFVLLKLKSFVLLKLKSYVWLKLKPFVWFQVAELTVATAQYANNNQKFGISMFLSKERTTLDLLCK